ncbi:ATP-dependent Clp protease proteolytic subunit 5, chloroplastic [Linum perenne]
MANFCASSPRFGSLVFSPNHISIPEPRSSALLLHHLRFASLQLFSCSFPCRKLRTVVSSIPASFQTQETTQRLGIWSIRDDLVIPASTCMPAQANAGQIGELPPSPVVAQQLQSVVTQLLQRRIIRCGGPLDESLANSIVAQLLYLESLDQASLVFHLFILFFACFFSGMAIFDIMRHIRADVSTVCVGLASSIGAFLLGAGTKGKRYSMPSSRIMIHQPLGGVIGSQTDIGIQSDELLHHKANLNTHLALITGQSLDKVYADTERDYFMSPKEAIAYGLIDGLVVNPLKASRPLETAAAVRQ